MCVGQHTYALLVRFKCQCSCYVEDIPVAMEAHFIGNFGNVAKTPINILIYLSFQGIKHVTMETDLWYYVMLLPSTLIVLVICMFIRWLGLKFYQHN